MKCVSVIENLAGFGVFGVVDDYIICNICSIVKVALQFLTYYFIFYNILGCTCVPPVISAHLKTSPHTPPHNSDSIMFGTKHTEENFNHLVTAAAYMMVGR